MTLLAQLSHICAILILVDESESRTWPLTPWKPPLPLKTPSTVFMGGFKVPLLLSVRCPDTKCSLKGRFTTTRTSRCGLWFVTYAVPICFHGDEGAPDLLNYGSTRSD